VQKTHKNHKTLFWGSARL